MNRNTIAHLSNMLIALVLLYITFSNRTSILLTISATILTIIVFVMRYFLDAQEDNKIVIATLLASFVLELFAILGILLGSNIDLLIFPILVIWAISVRMVWKKEPSTSTSRSSSTRRTSRNSSSRFMRNINFRRPTGNAHVVRNVFYHVYSHRRAYTVLAFAISILTVAFLWHPSLPSISVDRLFDMDNVFVFVALSLAVVVVAVFGVIQVLRLITWPLRWHVSHINWIKPDLLDHKNDSDAQRREVALPFWLPILYPERKLWWMWMPGNRGFQVDHLHGTISRQSEGWLGIGAPTKSIPVRAIADSTTSVSFRDSLTGIVVSVFTTRGDSPDIVVPFPSSGSEFPQNPSRPTENVGEGFEGLRNYLLAVTAGALKPTN